MVCARNVGHVAALHAMVAGKDIFEVHVERVTDVQVAVGVRRRHDNREGFTIARWCKSAAGFPEGVNVWFVLIWFVDFW